MLMLPLSEHLPEAVSAAGGVDAVPARRRHHSCRRPSPAAGSAAVAAGAGAAAALLVRSCPVFWCGVGRTCQEDEQERECKGDSEAS